jgi:hypothetical protein
MPICVSRITSGSSVVCTFEEEFEMGTFFSGAAADVCPQAGRMRRETVSREQKAVRNIVMNH